MAELYRKASLERLSSPEQLDKLIVIASPMVWLSVAGVALVIAVVTAWGFLGTLPDTVDITGMFTGTTQTTRVFAETSGKVEMTVKKNQTVKKDDVLARLGGSDIEQEIKRLEEEAQNVSNITLASTDDVSTSTTSKLLEIKINLQASGLPVNQQSVQLDALNKQLRQKTEEEKSLHSAYKEAEEAFLDSLSDDSFNISSFDYNQSSAEMEAAGQTYTAAVNAEAEQKGAYQALKKAMQEKYGVEIPNHLPNTVPDPLPPWCEGIDPAELETLFSAYLAWDDASERAAKAERTYLAAKDRFESDLEDYEDEFKSQNQNKSATTELQNKLTEASQRYSAVVSEITQLKGQIMQTQVQITTESMGGTLQANSLQTQFEKTKEAILADLNATLEQQRQALKPLQIIAPQDGVVTNVAVQKGQLVSAGTEMFKIKAQDTGEEAHSGVVCFVPLSDAKKLKPGMQVTITPSTVREQEYGHINAVVAEVAEYNATTTEMQQILGDDLMVSGIQQQQGPSVKVVVTPNTNSATASGFEWSNKNGYDVDITDGTMASLKVIIDEKAPISKLLPYLKDLFAMEPEEK